MASEARPPTHRLLAAQAYAALKKATAQLWRANGSAEHLSRDTRGSGDSLRNWADHNYAGFAPIDVIADGEVDAPFPVVTAELARIAGYLLVPGPDHLGEGAALKALKEIGDVIARYGELAADGEIDRLDAQKLRPECREAVFALLEWDAALAAAHPDTGPPMVEIRR